MEWVSVDDRLPKNGEEVLIHTLNGSFVGYYWTYGFEVGDVIGVSYDMASVIIEGKPTHWMPLPSPPEVK